jgi:hypothetical protein
MKESFIKYLAGIIDADGSMSFKFNKVKEGYTVHLRLYIASSEAVDKDFKMLRTVHKETGIGKLHLKAQKTSGGNWTGFWQVQARNELNILLPRLLKHLVIKGKHFNKLYRTYVELKGKKLTKEETDLLKELAQESRKKAGAIKPKKHPTWGWLAGYIDGDGHLKNKIYPKSSSHQLRLQAVCHKNDVVALELIQKAFGGSIRTPSTTPQLRRYDRNLGFSESSFSIKFLRKLVKYLIIKRYQAEQILHLHLQRLSENPSKEEAIVQSS